VTVGGGIVDSMDLSPAAMSRQEYCPSPPLPDGQVWLPKIDPAIQLENLRWFIESKNGMTIPPKCPLSRALALVENRHNPPLPSSLAEAVYLVRLVQAFRFADWGINALFAQQTDPTRHVEAVVHETFINAELFAADSSQAWHTLRHPLGIGTLYTAGRLVQGGRKGRITISGNKVEGYDINYESPLGPMLIERKDRAYEPGLNDTPQKQLEIVLEQIELKGPKIPRQGPARILSLGFWHGQFLSKDEFESFFWKAIPHQIPGQPDRSNVARLRDDRIHVWIQRFYPWALAPEESAGVRSHTTSAQTGNAGAGASESSPTRS